MSHLITSLLPGADKDSTTLIISTALTTFLALKLTSYLLAPKTPRKIIRGPATTVLPSLSQAEREKLPHPPDVYPGGRDVESPYGTTRVYEWGPEDGRKVLFVHGITTSCLPVGPIAHGLVERGCRVMIFDCWGRGYSDAPADLPHDERLYSTQILIAITSSPLSWTGASKFSLIGYSLGGGISAAFTSYFPNLVDSLVLVTPTGLIRPSRTVAQRRLFAIVSLLPKMPLEVFFRWKLQKPLFPNENAKLLKVKPVSVRYPHVTVMGAQQWQIRVHEGFFTSFMSTARYAPAAGQHESWRRLGLRKEKTLIIAATNDPIVNPRELKEDATEVLGADKLEWRVIEGAHDVPVTDPEKIVGAICDFWRI